MNSAELAAWRATARALEHTAKGMGYDQVHTQCDHAALSIVCLFVLPNNVVDVAYSAIIPYVLLPRQLGDAQREMRRICMKRRKELSRL